MLKRVDWLLLKGQDGGGTDSDSDTEGSEDERPAPKRPQVDKPSKQQATRIAGRARPHDSDSFTDSELSEEADDEEEDRAPRGTQQFARSLDDISDPDSEEGPSCTVADVLRAWESSDAEIRNFKGIPLRCTACSVLLLNAQTYHQHVNAKRHRAALKQCDDPEDVMQLAEDVAHPEDEDAETHMERLTRLQQQAQLQPQQAVQSGSAPRQAASKGRNAKALESRAEQAASNSGGSAQAGREAKPTVKRKRPGKNQRAALKVQLAEAASIKDAAAAAAQAATTAKAVAQQIHKLKRAIKGRKILPGKQPGVPLPVQAEA